MARKLGLQRQQVIAAAAAVADRDGLEAVTLARVASELGVRSPSLYSHVDGLAGLRRAMALDGVRRLGACISEAIRGRSGVEALTELAHAYRRFVQQHPGLYATLLPTPSRDEDEEVYREFAAPVAVIAEVLAAMGVAEADIVGAIRSVRSALHGFVSLEAGGGFGLPEDIDRSFGTLVSVFAGGIQSLATRS
jgi:AcrR family transcriptional regulator